MEVLGTAASGDGHLVPRTVVRNKLDRVGAAVSMVILVSSSLPAMGSRLSKMGSHTD